jgi:hypothetical protein
MSRYLPASYEATRDSSDPRSRHGAFERSDNRLLAGELSLFGLVKL